MALSDFVFRNSVPSNPVDSEWFGNQNTPFASSMTEGGGKLATNPFQTTSGGSNSVDMFLRLSPYEGMSTGRMTFTLLLDDLVNGASAKFWFLAQDYSRSGGIVEPSISARGAYGFFGDLAVGSATAKLLSQPWNRGEIQTSSALPLDLTSSFQLHDIFGISPVVGDTISHSIEWQVAPELTSVDIGAPDTPVVTIFLSFGYNVTDYDNDLNLYHCETIDYSDLTTPEALTFSLNQGRPGALPFGGGLIVPGGEFFRDTARGIAPMNGLVRTRLDLLGVATLP